MAINIEEYLSKFDKFTKDPNLQAMEYLMKAFDNPQDKFKIIHVAGTNGKGSVCEMLYSILTKTNYKIGKFISPHLIKFNDTISVNNKDITDNEAQEILKELSKKIEEYNNTHDVPVKWFEAITSLALIYFAKKNCDIVILETGLGGTDDCTNIVKSMISIITNVGYDHMDILGNTIEEITNNKAGIIKPNSDTIAVNQGKITEIIKDKCKKENTALHIVEEDSIKNYSYNSEYQTFSYKRYKDIKVNLKGEAQPINASECLECIDILKNNKYDISDEAIYNGLRSVIHRARFEVLSKKPLIIFDGGHNENAIKNLKQTINKYYEKDSKVYIVSILQTKDYKTIIKNLCKDNICDTFIFTTGNDVNRYVSKEDLFNEAQKYTHHIYKYDLPKAINIATKTYKDKTIFIVGSFYVYKTVREVLNDQIKQCRV